MVVYFVLQDINPQGRNEFQTIQFGRSIVFVYEQTNVKTVLFQIIQFYIST